MAIDVTCPAGHSFKVKQAYAGRSGRCPQCGETVSVPAGATLHASGPAGKQDQADSAGSGSELKVAADGIAAAGIATAVGKASTAQGAIKRLGRFELTEVVGTGGFGTVYRARDPQLDRDVALKVPRSGALADDDDANRFLREAKASAQLRHPNIVAVYEAGQIDGTYYIAAGFVEGTTLRQAIKDRGAFTQRDAAALVAKLAAALHYAHGKGIVHRDVKPANAMLDAAGEPLIMDFGLARRDEGDGSRTMEGMILGTPAYMSPEQAQGRGHLADARSDLWSLGVILYELLTGQKPFQGGDTDVMIAVRVRDPDPPRKLDRTIPRDLETICLKCLVKSPDGRYATCQELADELDRWLRGDPIRARRISPVERFGRWARRNPAAATLGTVAALLLLAVVGDQFVANRRLTESREQIEGALAKAEEYGRQQKAALDQLRREEAAKERAEAARIRAEESAAIASAAKTKAEKLADSQSKARESAESQLRPDSLLEYSGRLRGSQDAIARGDRPLALKLLNVCPEDFRSWEWRYLLQRTTEDKPPQLGRTASNIADITFDSRSNQMAMLGDREVTIIDSHTGGPISYLPCAGIGFPEKVHFCVGDRLLVRNVGGQTRIYDLSRNQPANEGLLHPSRTTAILSAHGRGVAFKFERGEHVAYAEDLVTKLRTYQGVEPGAKPLAISPDVSSVVFFVPDQTATQDPGLWLVNPRTGFSGYLADFGQIDFTPRDRTRQPLISGFSPDGVHFILRHNRGIAVWDVANGTRLAFDRHVHEWLPSIAPGVVSADGRRVARIDEAGREVLICDLEFGTEMMTLSVDALGDEHRTAARKMTCVRFSPDGLRLVVGCSDGAFAILEGGNADATDRDALVR